MKDNPIYVRAVLCAYREETRDDLNRIEKQVDRIIAGLKVNEALKMSDL